MFQECKELEYLNLNNFITSNVTDMGWMFSECRKLKEIQGVNNFDTSKVINMEGIFSDCIELEYLDLSNFDTSNLTAMPFMFYGCCKLKEIKGINNINISKVNKMEYLFEYCKELKYVDLSKFSNKNILAQGKDVSFICIYDVKDYNEIQIINDRYKNEIKEEIKSKIKILNGDNKEELLFKNRFDKLGLHTIYFSIEKQLKNISFLFSNCTSLKKVEFLSVDTSQINTMKGMFEGCKELEYLDLTNFDTSNSTDISFIFLNVIN